MEDRSGIRGRRGETDGGRGSKEAKKLTPQLRSLPFRGAPVGESRAGAESVGEFSFSSLKLKLFL